MTGGMRAGAGLPLSERARRAAGTSGTGPAAGTPGAGPLAATPGAGPAPGAIGTEPTGTEPIGGRPGRRQSPGRRSGASAPPVHCWVATAEGRCPGVLIEWQHDGDRWWGLAAYVTTGRRPVLLSQLVPAEALSPA